MDRVSFDRDGDAYETVDGDFVNYEETMDALAKKDAEIAAVKARVAGLKAD